VRETAIISDVHGNLEGLEAALVDIERQGIEDVVCLGDIVGYGPNPAECADRVRERCHLVIRGNHDDALIHGPIGFTHMAREAIEWTRRCLRPRLWRRGSAERWKFLENLPIQANWEDFLLVHGSPRDPTSEYIMDRDLAMGDYQKFAEIFALVGGVCLVGHTHVPGVFFDEPDRTRWVAERDMGGPFRHENTKMVINVGSVGQPRDRDPRACYLTVNPTTREFQFHRVDYDVQVTRRKIHETPGLSDQLGDRLEEGV
jgi:diadenosine tetraphosphatase ApaH/serine/threonine PP2A family protein phosphatase